MNVEGEGAIYGVPLTSAHATFTTAGSFHETGNLGFDEFGLSIGGKDGRHHRPRRRHHGRHDRRRILLPSARASNCPSPSTTPASATARTSASARPPPPSASSSSGAAASNCSPRAAPKIHRRLRRPRLGHRAPLPSAGTRATLARWARATEASTPSATIRVAGVTRSPSSRRSPADGDHRLQELELADLRDAAAGQARVPGEEAEEHRAEGEVGDARGPSRGGGSMPRSSNAAAAASGTVMGAPRTSAQEIVRGPPISRASAPPSA